MRQLSILMMATRNPAFTHQLIWLNFPMSIRLVVKSRWDFWGCHQQYVCVTLAAASPPVLLRSKAVNFLILHWLITCPPLITSPEVFYRFRIFCWVSPNGGNTQKEIKISPLGAILDMFIWNGEAEKLCVHRYCVSKCIYTSLHRSVF